MSTSIPAVEPWLRGTHTEVSAPARAVLHALDLTREDVDRWATQLSDAELHAQPFGLPSVAFHLRHILGTVDRLLIYAEGGELTADHIAILKSEADGVQPGQSETASALLERFRAGLDRAAGRIRALAASDLEQFRGVGRKQLPTSVGGALIHVADHTQRHAGQIVTSAKLLLAQRNV